ncbi:MAG: UDP-N-acetylglucosamine 2-epimerase (non-hydrolyzing) [Burkholderiaceae bacterium]
MKLTLVAGARPNFMKIAPMIRSLSKHPDKLQWRLVHTGQHYDHGMNDVFFEELGIPAPNASLGCGGGGHSEQTARIMTSFDDDLSANPTDWVIVVGDVNSTLACAIVARKKGVRVAHVEAGLRSGDMSMPEEINRLVTDSISDLFFTTEPAANAHLKREGKSDESIHFVGHVMIDNLFYQVDRLSNTVTKTYNSENLKQELQKKFGRYGAVTLHRPANVDNADNLRGIVNALRKVAQDLPLVFPVHPRTAQTLEKHNIDAGENIHLLPALPYMEFLNLWKDAQIILTDSGGLQEESTALGVRCVTIRENTERPVTIDQGTNILAGTNPENIIKCARESLARPPSDKRPPLWDGKAADRIAQIFLNLAKEKN